MTVRNSRDSFITRFRRQRSIADPIAADRWKFKDPKGKRRAVRIEVGRPQPIPHDKQGDWFTAVFIEGWTDHVVPAFGVGPLDSLMNAVALLRDFHEQIGWLQISQESTKRRNRRRSG
jgi:hypothetical protein